MHSILPFFILAVLSACARATPIPWDKPAAVSASTGQGGNAPGGSVYEAPSLVSVLSGNAGNGGDSSSSGDADASDSSRTNSAGSSDNVLEGTPFGGGLVNVIPSIGGEHGVNNIL